MEEHLPAYLKRYLAENNINFYIIDAVDIAQKIGLGARINMIMQAVFFKLAKVIPLEEAVRYLKNSIEKTYGRKGSKIVEMNKAAVEEGIAQVIKVEIPADWAQAEESPKLKRKNCLILFRKFTSRLPAMKGMNCPPALFSRWKTGVSP